MKTFKLKRTTQCKNCPFKKTTNPFDIPNGYDEQKHKNLEDTIAKDEILPSPSSPLKAMACHHAPSNP